MKTKVLIVDDEGSFTQLLKLNLEATGQYEVRVENWAEDAWAAAREFRPDVIFLDVMMPRMFGGEVAARVRADPDLQQIPIIFLTAAIRRERVAEHEGVIQGFPVLAKPASTAEIIQCIQKHLPEDRPRAA